MPTAATLTIACVRQGSSIDGASTARWRSRRSIFSHGSAKAQTAAFADRRSGYPSRRGSCLRCRSFQLHSLQPSSAGVDDLQPRLAVRVRAARGAPDEIQAPVQIDHRPAPGGLVQPVDVLGKEKPTSILGLQARQGVMRVVGQGLPEPAPADHAARPAASARQLLRHECLEADRLRSFPVAVAIAITGNA
jgi:hypothetical protein